MYKSIIGTHTIYTTIQLDMMFIVLKNYINIHFFSLFCTSGKIWIDNVLFLTRLNIKYNKDTTYKSSDAQ